MDKLTTEDNVVRLVLFFLPSGQVIIALASLYIPARPQWKVSSSMVVTFVLVK